MNGTAGRIFESWRNIKCVLDRRTRILLFGSMNIRSKHKDIMKKPKFVVKDMYQRPDMNIGLYGYSLLASNATNRYDYLQFVV